MNSIEVIPNWRATGDQNSNVFGFLKILIEIKNGIAREITDC
jgi:hypothetical protein